MELSLSVILGDENKVKIGLPRVEEKPVS